MARPAVSRRRAAAARCVALFAAASCALILAGGASRPAAGELPGRDWTRRIDRRCVLLLERETVACAGEPAGPTSFSLPDLRPVGFAFDSLLWTRGRIRLLLDAGPARTDAAALRDACARAVPSLDWEGDVGCWGQATLDLADLPVLGEVEELFFALLPPHGVPMDARSPETAGESPLADEVLSEGAAEIGAPSYVDKGVTGEGIGVGVLDLGFADLSAVWGSEIPADTKTRSFYQSPEGEGDLEGGGDPHGTACAEIVHDVAPGARLYLVNVYTLVDLAAAVDWLAQQGVSVISHSVGWFFGPGDGTGSVCDIARSASERGILWVNAAGNQADTYWQGDFRDADGDGWAEIAGDDEGFSYAPGAGGSSFSFVLTWDRWPHSPDLSFAIDLWEDGQPLFSSEQDYGESWPYAYQDLGVLQIDPDAAYEVRLRKTRGTGEARLRLFRLDGQPIGEHAIESGSLVIPADAPEVLTIGAYRAGEGFLESFSSRGPTQAGLAKPELCAPDGVHTATFGLFGGTSAACPHAAGAAALLLDAAPPGGFFDFHWTVDELRRLFRWGAAPDAFEPDACAWGLLRLPRSAEPGLPGAAARGTLAVASPARPPLRASFVPSTTGAHLARIQDPEGRVLAQFRLPDAVPGHPVDIVWPHDAADLSTGWYWLTVRGPGGQASRRVLLLR